MYISCSKSFEQLSSNAQRFYLRAFSLLAELAERRSTVMIGTKIEEEMTVTPAVLEALGNPEGVIIVYRYEGVIEMRQQHDHMKIVHSEDELRAELRWIAQLMKHDDVPGNVVFLGFYEYDPPRPVVDVPNGIDPLRRELREWAASPTNLNLYPEADLGMSVQWIKCMTPKGQPLFPLGNHWHPGGGSNCKLEIFVVVSGKGYLAWQPMNYNGTPMGPVKLEKLRKGYVFRVEPGVAHAVMTERGSKLELIAYSTSIFRPEHMIGFSLMRPLQPGKPVSSALN